MKSGRGMPPLLTTRSWILRSIWRMLSTSDAHAVAQLLDLARGEADLHQLALTFFCSSRYFGALWPSFCSTDEHPRVELADRREARERRDLQTLEILRGDRAGVAFVLARLDVVVDVLERVERLVEVHQAVDQVVDLELVLLDLRRRGRGSARPSSGTPRSP